MRVHESRFDRLPTLDPIQVGRPRLRLKNPVLATGGEVIDNSLYAFFSVALATPFADKIVLFQNSVGQSYTPIGGTAFALTLLHTNVEGAGGQLPNGYKLDIQAIRMVVDEAIQFLDLDNLKYNTFGVLNIGQKYYWEGPLSEIPGNVGSTLSNSPATNGPANSNGSPANLKGVYSLSAGLEATIAYGQNFNFTIDPTISETGIWSTQTDDATPPGVGIRGWIHLDGVWTRPTQ